MWDTTVLQSPQTPPGKVTVSKTCPPRREVALVCAMLVIACAAVFGRTLTHQFVNLDDALYVTKNWHVQSGLSLESVRWAFVTEDAHYFHPLTWISHMLDCRLYGLRAWGHHLTSLVIHTAASVLLFLALRLLTGALWRCAAVAMLFAIHPLHVESVAWVAERKDVLSAFFWMLALAAYGLYARRGGAARHAAVVAAFVLGLMSKPMVVTLPFVLLLLDCWPLGRINLSAPPRELVRTTLRLAASKTLLFLITAVSCASTLIMQSHAINLAYGEKVPFAPRIANAVFVYALYLAKTLWPSGLAVFYPHPITRPMALVAVAALLLAGITLFCLCHARRRPYLIVGWLWYLGTLVPVIEVVQAGEFSHADRYTYLPLIGIFIMVAWGMADLAAHWRVPKRALAAISGIVLVSLGICANIQAGYWRDSQTLFGHALAVGQESGIAYNNLGVVALEQKRHADARALFFKALQLTPKSTDALYNLGRVALEEGNYGELEACMYQVLNLDPAHVQALNNLGVSLIYQGRYEEAEQVLRRALQLDPEHIPALENLGGVLAQLGRQEEADKHAKKAAELKSARRAGKT